MRIAVGVEQTTHLCQYLRQNTEQGGGDGDRQRVLRLVLLNSDPSGMFLDPHCSAIGIVPNDLHAGNGTFIEKAQRLHPAVGWAIPNLDRKAVISLHLPSNLLSQRTGREFIFLLEDSVEASQAAKARGHRHVHHCQPRVRQQLLGQQQAAGLTVL